MNEHASPLSRRAFVKNAIVAAAGAAAGCTQFSARVEAAEPRPCSPSKWQKHGIILEASESWEGENVQNFTTCAEPLDQDRWRLWYSVSDERRGYQIAIAEGVPGQPLKKTPALCTSGDPVDAPLAIGNLPATWKPVQPVHIRLRDGRHRLYFWAHGKQVSRYVAAESNDGRRYRVLDPLRPVLYHPNDRASFGVPSPDGVMYRPKRGEIQDGEPAAISRLISNDATNVYQLPDGTFEMYSVAVVRVPKSDPAYIAEDNAPGLIRVVDRYTSEDGLKFETRQRVIQRDDKDPADQQFYYLAVTDTPKGRVGLLGHYRCAAQTMDLEWCFSKDGIQWQRPQRSAWLPRGDQGSADCYGIYAGHNLVQHAGKWHLFYTGANETHNHKRASGKARQVVMHATVPSIWND